MSASFHSKRHKGGSNLVQIKQPTRNADLTLFASLYPPCKALSSPCLSNPAPVCSTVRPQPPPLGAALCEAVELWSCGAGACLTCRAASSIQSPNRRIFSSVLFLPPESIVSVRSLILCTPRRHEAAFLPPPNPLCVYLLCPTQQRSSLPGSGSMPGPSAPQCRPLTDTRPLSGCGQTGVRSLHQPKDIQASFIFLWKNS